MKLSGDNASLTLANKRLNEKREKQDQYEQDIGLPALRANREECEYLDITGAEISRLSPDKCIEIAGDLSSYVIHVQRTLSKEKAILRWLDEHINLTIANELNDYAGYYSHQQRRDIAIVNNAYAKELEILKINSQLKVDMLEGLTYQINQLCRVLLEAQKGKKWEDQR